VATHLSALAHHLTAGELTDSLLDALGTTDSDDDIAILVVENVASAGR
jgi:hypothetical protein